MTKMNVLGVGTDKVMTSISVSTWEAQTETLPHLYEDIVRGYEPGKETSQDAKSVSALS